MFPLKNLARKGLRVKKKGYVPGLSAVVATSYVEQILLLAQLVDLHCSVQYVIAM